MAKRAKSLPVSPGESLEERLRKAGATNPKPVTWRLRPEILLCPNIPKPLSEVAPRNLLPAKWWEATRQEAYKSTAYHCIACGVSKHQARGRSWLEAHEVYEIDYKKGLSTYIETVPLCHFCHNYIHDGRLKNLLMQGKISHVKYVAILQHGDRVLKAADIFRLPHDLREQQIIHMQLAGELAPWHKWRLVVNGKKYPPKYKSLEQWQKAFEQ